MRILVIRLSSLGDIVLTQPVLRELRSLHPEAEIHYLCKPEYAALPKLFGVELTVWEYSKKLGWHFSLLKQRYDIILDLHAKLASALVRLMVRGRHKIVYAKQRGLRRRIVRGDKTAAIESTVHLYCSALERLEPERFKSGATLPRPQLDLPTTAEKPIALPLRSDARQLVGLFVGAAHANKAYPMEQWMELLRQAPERYEFWLLGSAADEPAASRIKEAFPAVTDLCGKLTLAELPGAIAACDIVISGDSGPMHIAAALDKPQIAIFGSTHPRLGFAPLNTKAAIISAELSCQPCSLHGSKSCPRGHFRCMRSIAPNQILSKLEELLPQDTEPPARLR